MNPFISVVMPVFNSEKYLEKSIKSILEQTYSNFEFIIINDGSTDASLDIIKLYQKKDKRIVLINQKNKGISYSTNRGFLNARGKYIARMDSDDISLHSRLYEQVNFMEKNPKVGICGSWAEKFKDSVNEKKIVKVPIDDKMKIVLLYTSCFFQSSVMFRAKLIRKYQVKYNTNYLNAGDYELWTRVKKLTKFANIAKPLILYRDHEGGISKRVKNYSKVYKVDNFKKIFKSELIQHNIDVNKNLLDNHYNIARSQLSLLNYNILVSHFELLNKKISNNYIEYINAHRYLLITYKMFFFKKKHFFNLFFKKYFFKSLVIYLSRLNDFYT